MQLYEKILHCCEYYRNFTHVVTSDRNKRNLSSNKGYLVILVDLFLFPMCIGVLGC